jgi:hypothetical protein
MGGQFKDFLTPRAYPQKGDWNELVDQFKSLPISVQEIIL